MKKLIILLLLFCLPSGSALSADLEKVKGERRYTVKLTDNADLLIGDEKERKFVPKIHSSKWNGECFLEIKYTKDKVTDEIEKFSGDKIELELGNLTHKYYVVGKSLEYEIVLKTKPSSNKLEFDIDFPEGLRFTYQPPLHPDHPTWLKKKKNGKVATIRRPENVVGSYAVYWNKRNNQYKTGKFCHIYRPKVIDDSGDWMWAELAIDSDKKKLTITIDKEWLDGADYPVKIDPNLGYDSIGGSTENDWANYILFNGIGYTTDASGGTIGDAYVYAIGAGKAKMAIYDSNDEGRLIEDSVSNEIDITPIGGWFSASSAGGTLLASTTYYPAIDNDTEGIEYYYDENGADGVYDSCPYITFPPDPCGSTSSWIEAEYSFYFEYSAAPSGPLVGAVMVVD